MSFGVTPAARAEYKAARLCRSFCAPSLWSLSSSKIDSVDNSLVDLSLLSESSSRSATEIGAALELARSYFADDRRVCIHWH